MKRRPLLVSAAPAPRSWRGGATTEAQCAVAHARKVERDLQLSGTARRRHARRSHDQTCSHSAARAANGMHGCEALWSRERAPQQLATSTLTCMHAVHTPSIVAASASTVHAAARRIRPCAAGLPGTNRRQRAGRAPAVCRLLCSYLPPSPPRRGWQACGIPRWVARCDAWSWRRQRPGHAALRRGAGPGVRGPTRRPWVSAGWRSIWDTPPPPWHLHGTASRRWLIQPLGCITTTDPCTLMKWDDLWA